MKHRGKQAEILQQMAAVCGGPEFEAKEDDDGEYFEIDTMYLLAWAEAEEADKAAAEQSETEATKWRSQDSATALAD